MQKISEYDAVSATISKYIDGIIKSDTQLIREAFHSQAGMSGHFPAPDRPGAKAFAIVPAAETIVSYMNSVPPTRQTSPNFQGRILAIDLFDTVASATIAERNLEGSDFLTYFHLHKVDGRWQITAKATYSQPAKGE
ncbi:MAG: nuclear transport factor 2 family protein [Gammaproteobacteria bacterium]